MRDLLPAALIAGPLLLVGLFVVALVISSTRLSRTRNPRKGETS